MQLDQLLVSQCTRRLRRHGLSCRSRRRVRRNRSTFASESAWPWRFGAVAQADAPRVDLRDDGEAGGARQPFHGRPRRELSVRRRNRVLGLAASSDGRRTVAVTAARGRTVAPPLTRGGRYFMYRPLLGSREPSDPQRAAGSERRKASWRLIWA
jgi:hypothetical protein